MKKLADLIKIEKRCNQLFDEINKNPLLDDKDNKLILTLNKLANLIEKA